MLMADLIRVAFCFSDPNVPELRLNDVNDPKWIRIATHFDIHSIWVRTHLMPTRLCSPIGDAYTCVLLYKEYGLGKNMFSSYLKRKREKKSQFDYNIFGYAKIQPF